MELRGFAEEQVALRRVATPVAWAPPPKTQRAFGFVYIAAGDVQDAVGLAAQALEDERRVSAECRELRGRLPPCPKAAPRFPVSCVAPS